MLITLLTNLAGHTFAYAAGETADVDDKIAQQWINAGLARPARPVKRRRDDADDAGPD